MSTDDGNIRTWIDLTGPSSHELVIKLGQGSILVGEPGPDFNPDLVVDAATHIDWTAFNGMTTPAGGAWPRYIVYRGQNLSVFEWMQTRPTEQLSFSATAPVHIDASATKISALSISSEGHPLTLAMPSAEATWDLGLRGDPGDFHLTPHSDGTPPPLRFGLPDTPLPRRDPSIKPAVRGLPPLEALDRLDRISIVCHPLQVPFDAGTLAQFSQLRSVNLHGSMTGLEALGDLPLRSVEARFVPDLSGLPALTSWPELERITVWNCDAVVTKRIRAELRGLSLTGEYSSASKPRDMSWFFTEYALPFGAWPTKQARIAVKAFRATSKALSSASSAAEALSMIDDFVRTANQFDRIETTDREDLGGAVVLLADITDGLLDRDQALARFDALRDF